MVSRNRVEEIQAFFNENGTEKTKQEYKLSEETLSRYLRHARFFDRKQVKILLLDVETAPMQVFLWGLYKQRPNYENVIRDWFIISWAAKWLNDPTVKSDVLTSKEAVVGDDRRLMGSIWKLLDDADIIIGHNCQRFDTRRLMTRFILNGYKPPSSFKQVDTLKVAQRIFSFASNRLDYIGKLIRNKGKIETDFGLWKRCYAGEEEALGYMEKYNKEDVVLLEEAYLFLRPYIKSHPNIGVYAESEFPVCANCGSANVVEADSYYFTQANKYPEYRCLDCGAVSHAGVGTMTSEQRRGLLRPNAV